MMKCAQVALIALALPVVAFAQERIEFKGVPLGASLAEFKQKNPMFWCQGNECTLPYLGNSVYQCQELKRTSDGMASGVPTTECILEINKSATYANLPARLSARFQDDALHEASATFLPERFGAIVEALAQRFGAPASKRSEVVRNQLGATFQNEVWRWSILGDEIVAMKYGGDLTRGLVNIADAQEVKRRTDAAERRRKSAPSDL